MNLVQKVKENFVEKPFESCLKVCMVAGGIVGAIVGYESVKQYHDSGLEFMAVCSGGTVGYMIGAATSIIPGIATYLGVRKHQTPEIVFIEEEENGYNAFSVKKINIRTSKKKEQALTGRIKIKEHHVNDKSHCMYEQLKNKYVVYSDYNLVEATDTLSEAKTSAFTQLLQHYQITDGREVYFKKFNDTAWKKFNFLSDGCLIGVGNISLPALEKPENP